jgi:hypothetical protein
MSTKSINTRRISLVTLVAFLAITLAVPSVGVFASSSSLNVMTTKSAYTGMATIKIVGRDTPAPSHGTVASIVVNDPDGVHVATATVPVIHGVFTANVMAGSSLWKLSGTYTVKATVSGKTATTTFTYTAA